MFCCDLLLMPGGTLLDCWVGARRRPAVVGCQLIDFPDIEADVSVVKANSWYWNASRVCRGLLHSHSV